MAWFLVLLALAATVLLLDRFTLTWVVLLGAIVTAVVGSFSSLQGLLIWPTGLVLLCIRRRRISHVSVWIAGAIATTLFYFHNFTFSAVPLPHFARNHPLVALKFFLFAIGDVIGKPVATATSSFEDTLVMVFGLCIVLLAVGTLLLCGLRHDGQGSSPVGIALICFGLLFAAMITQGRSFFGYVGASQSRYTTFDLLILIGIYMALLGRRERGTALLLETEGSIHLTKSSVNPRLPATGWSFFREQSGYRSLAYSLTLVLVAIIVQVSLGTNFGMQRARQLHAYDVQAAKVLKNIEDATNGEIVTYLNVSQPASDTRQLAQTLK